MKTRTIHDQHNLSRRHARNNATRIHTVDPPDRISFLKLFVEHYDLIRPACRAALNPPPSTTSGRCSALRGT